MPRPCKKKCVSSIPSYTAFIHTDEPIPASHIQMSVEEYETIRLMCKADADQQRQRTIPV